MTQRNLRIVAAMAITAVVYQPLAVSAAPDARPTAAETAVAPTYDGAALMAGLFFGAGPVAALFPELYGNPSPTSAAERDVILSRINTDHPGLLDDFSSAMQSGDHVLIADKLQYAGRIVSKSTDVAFADENGKPEDMIVINFFVVANIAVAVQVVSWVMLWILEPEVDGSIGGGGMDSVSLSLTSHSRLQRDYMVSLIAERLAT